MTILNPDGKDNGLPWPTKAPEPAAEVTSAHEFAMREPETSLASADIRRALGDEEEF